MERGKRGRGKSVDIGGESLSLLSAPFGRHLRPAVAYGDGYYIPPPSQGWVIALYMTTSDYIDTAQLDDSMTGEQSRLIELMG
jgi:hypothetical protein